MTDDKAKMNARPDVAAALADAAFASLARAGAPVVVAAGAPPRVIHANRSALRLFGAEELADLTERLFAADEPAARRLAELAQTVLPGAAARVERVGLRTEFAPRAVTLLCRRTAGADPLFVLAGLGLRAGHAGGPRDVSVVEAQAPAVVAPVAAPVAVVAPTSPVAASAASFLAFRAAMEQRFPGLAPARFLWRTDAANIVTEITPPLSEIVGPGCADFVGRDFGEAVRSLGLDPQGALTQALRGRATFSRIDLDWPIENAAAAAPVTLGALPAFDAAQAFDGWRGFGVIHLDALREAPVFVAPVRAAEPPAVAPSVEAPTPNVAPHEFSGVVVPLRPFAVRPAPAPQEPPAAEKRAETPADEERPPNRPGADDSDSALVALAPHERNAFREIARALGARGDDGASLAASDAQAELDAGPAVEAAAEPPAFAPDFAEVLPLGLAVLRDGQTLFANRRLLGWLGFADFAAFERAGGLRACCRGGAPELQPAERRSLLLRPADGEPFTADAQRAPVRWAGGPAECLTLSRPSAAALEQRVGVLESGLRLRESEANEVLGILDTAGDGFLLINGDGVILGLNRPAENLFGYGRDQVAGENFTYLLAPESQAAARECFARSKSGDHRGGREVAGRTRQGAAIPLHLAFGRLGPSAHGRDPANGKYCAVLRDLSPWKMSAVALEEARGQAQRDSDAKSALLAKVSHEVRTPLNAILGFAEVIMDERFGPIGNERYKEYLKDIHASGAHVMSLVNDLLDLSKIEAGKMDLAFSAVDANRIVSECVALIQPQANRERVITRLALAPRLPAIFADERSLRQIVLNLLANAVRYNEPGGQVIVSTALSGAGRAVLRVRDTGVGMSESDLRKALEPFGQAAPARAAGGTGLGLPLTKALAEANRADFAIRSAKNEGTLVEVTFPLAPGAAEVAPAAGKAG